MGATTADQPPDDRRAEPRRPIRLKVAYRTAQSLVTEYTSSVSKGGCRLRTRRALAVGTRFVFEMYIRPGESPVEVLGEVLWCHPQENGEHEVGLRYDRSMDGRAALDRALDLLFAEGAYDKARLHPRVVVRLPVVDAHRPERHYLLKDLSRGGMGLQMPVVQELYGDLQPGVLLVLLVKVGDAPPIELGAEVVWTSPMTASARAAAGAAFVGIGLEQQEALERLIRLHAPTELRLTVGPKRR